MTDVFRLRAFVSLELLSQKYKSMMTPAQKFLYNLLLDGLKQLGPRQLTDN